MEFFDKLYSGLNEHPTAALLALSLVAVWYLFKIGREADARHADQVQAMHAAHLQTALQIVPLTNKLVDAVESVERGYTLALQQRLTGGATP